MLGSGLFLAGCGSTHHVTATPRARNRHVPFVVGQLEGQAVRKVMVAGFRVEVIRGRDRQVPRGLVARQRPTGGSVAQVKTLVRLYVSAGR